MVPASLPSGTVTFVLTDIAGSSAMWERGPHAMAQAVARHDALIAAAVERHGGVIVKSRGEGDSVFAVFAGAPDALAAACDAQLALHAEPWPTDQPLRVRMAMHAGEAELRHGDYFGAAVNRAGRLRAIAHGGQVLLSSAVADLVGGALPPDASLRDLGLLRLRDLAHPERVFQLDHPRLTRDFAPLYSHDAAASNLPQPLSSFIGREQEVAQVRRLVESTRLVTLTGSAGCGKTRLALRIAADMAAAFEDGVWFVDLSGVGDPALVPSALAGALRIEEQTRPEAASTGGGEPAPRRADSGPVSESIIRVLKTRTALLILDNCEHLLDAAATLTERILRGTPRTRILATSREPLGVAGETALRVPSLKVPDTDAPRDPGALLGFDAVRLFVDRASQNQPGFALTPDNAADIARLCQRLDGIPLALELAAARVRALTIGQIARRLDDCFRLLTGGSRTALPRQQTLQAAIDWSHNLLTDQERALLRRLAVFSGGWTLDAAEDVCAVDPIAPGQVLDLLWRLVEKSLVLFDDEAQPPRYRLLEIVRQYARWRQMNDGRAEDTAQVRGAHVRHFLRLAEEAETHLSGPEQAAWLGRLDAEQDNFRAALQAAADAGSGEESLRLATALHRYWYVRGRLREGRHWLEMLIERRPEAADLMQAKALNAAGILARRQGDNDAARQRFEAALTIAERLQTHEQSAGVLNNLALLAQDEGEFDVSRQLYAQAIGHFQRLGMSEKAAMAQLNLGALLLDMGQHAEAEAVLRKCLPVFERIGDRERMTAILHNLAEVALCHQDFTTSFQLISRSLAMKIELGNPMSQALTVELLARVHEVAGAAQDAVSLLALAKKLWKAAGGLPPPRYQHIAESLVCTLRGQMGRERFDAAWAAGSAMDVHAALSEARTRLAHLET